MNPYSQVVKIEDKPESLTNMVNSNQ